MDAREVRKKRAAGCLMLLIAAGAGTAQEAPQTLGRIEVTADAVEPDADGPVGGYAAKRSRTATKTDTPLNEVPQSVTVISEEQIRDQSAGTMQEVLRYTAGARPEMYGLDNRGDWFTMRGGSEGSTLLDGLRLPLTGWYGVMRNEPFAFERVEVLRGPASVIAGQNGPGGVVNLVSKRPLADARYEFTLQTGNHAHRQLGADLTGPLDADRTLRYRLLAFGKDSGTQVEHADEERTLIAPSIAWQPRAGTELHVYGEYQKDQSGNTNAFLGYEGTLLPAPHGAISPSLFIGEPDWDRYGGERTRVGYRIEQALGENWTLRHNLRHDRIRGAMRTMYAAWWLGFADANGNADQDGTYLNRLWYATDNRARVTNADLLFEGKLRQGRVQHTLLLGADAMRNNDDQYYWNDGFATPLDVYNPVYGTFADPTLGNGPVTSDRTRVRNVGALAQDQIKIDDRLVLVVGLRHDQARTEGAPRESATTKNLGMLWLGGGGWSPYASYAESFEPVAGSDASGNPFRPKRGRQVEAGVKWMPQDQRINATAAVYRLQEQNRLATDPVNVNFSIQRGEVTVSGAELEVSADLAAWNLIGSYSYTDARVTSTTPDDIRYLDAQLNSIPLHSAALWAVHRFRTSRLPGLRAGVGVRYVGRVWDGLDTVSVPAYTLYDAMLAYEQERWSLSFNVNNVADKTYLANCLERGDCWFGSKRKIVASVRFHW